MLRKVHGVSNDLEALRPEGKSDRRVDGLHVRAPIRRVLACLSSQIEGEAPSLVRRYSIMTSRYEPLLILPSSSPQYDSITPSLECMFLRHKEGCHT